MLPRLDALLRPIERGFAWLAAAAMLVVMAVIAADATLRYLFNAPLSWATELVGLFLMVLMFYGALSSAFVDNSHIRVDLLPPRLSARAQRLLEALGCLLAAPAFALIALLAGERAWVALVGREVLSGLIAWPTWPPPAFAALGAGLLALRLLFNAAAHVAALAGGTPCVRLPSEAAGHGAAGRAE